MDLCAAWPDDPGPYRAQTAVAIGGGHELDHNHRHGSAHHHERYVGLTKAQFREQLTFGI
jgi:hypothetical protein